MSERGFELRFAGTDEEPAWLLVWQDDSGARQTEIDCDVERGGTFSRGDCMGELVHFLPAHLRERFTQLSKDLGYPAGLDEINAALARLDDQG